jgi:biopolymer transport protein ExbB
MKRITTIIAAGLLVLGLGTAQAQDDGASSMAELLRLIEQGQARDSQEARQREADFARRRNEQQNLLNQARAERSRQERESARLEQLFEDQQAQIVAARAALDERLGALKELFGVLQTVAGDTQGRFTNSLTNIQFPDRGNFLVELGGKMAGASTLASIEDIEQLWYLLQQEITESGAISRFNHSVTRADGTEEQMQIARIGVFNLVFEDGYLQYDPGCLKPRNHPLPSVSTLRVVASWHCSLNRQRSRIASTRAASWVTASLPSASSACSSRSSVSRASRTTAARFRRS